MVHTATDLVIQLTCVDSCKALQWLVAGGRCGEEEDEEEDACEGFFSLVVDKGTFFFSVPFKKTLFFNFVKNTYREL